MSRIRSYWVQAVDLEAGEEAEMSFVLAWHFPHRELRRSVLLYRSASYIAAYYTSRAQAQYSPVRHFVHREHRT